MEIREFVLAEHVDIIKEFCRKEKCRISFRRAGKDTITRLQKGSPCKGHEILAKSIKDKTLNKLDTPLDKGQAALLRGRIGKWEGDCEQLLGVYISQHAKTALAALKSRGEEPIGFWELVENADDGNTVPLCPELFDFLGTEGCDPYFLTGDYDIHDLFYCEAGHYLPCPEAKAMELLQRLNDQMMAASREEYGGGTIETNEFSFIRHGAQINYCTYMIDHESEKKLAYPVVTADYDVAFFDEKGTVTVCCEYAGGVQAGYEKWYKDHYQIIKATFAHDYDAILRTMVRNVEHEYIAAQGMICMCSHKQLEKDDAQARDFLMQLKGYIGSGNDLFPERGPVEPADFVKGLDPAWAAGRVVELYQEKPFDRVKDDTLFYYCYRYLLTYMIHNEVSAICFDLPQRKGCFPGASWTNVLSTNCEEADFDLKPLEECVAMLENYYDLVKEEGTGNSQIYQLQEEDLAKWRQVFYPLIKQMAVYGIKNEAFFGEIPAPAKVKGIDENGRFMKYGYCNLLYQLYRFLLGMEISTAQKFTFDDNCTLILETAQMAEAYVPYFDGQPIDDGRLYAFKEGRDMAEWRNFYHLNTREELVRDGSFFGNYRGCANLGIGADGAFFGRELLHFLAQCYKTVYVRIQEGI